MLTQRRLTRSSSEISLFQLLILEKNILDISTSFITELNQFQMHMGEQHIQNEREQREQRVERFLFWNL